MTFSATTRRGLVLFALRRRRPCPLRPADAESDNGRWRPGSHRSAADVANLAAGLASVLVKSARSAPADCPEEEEPGSGRLPGSGSSDGSGGVGRVMGSPSLWVERHGDRTNGCERPAVYLKQPDGPRVLTVESRSIASALRELQQATPIRADWSQRELLELQRDGTLTNLWHADQEDREFSEGSLPADVAAAGVLFNTGFAGVGSEDQA